MTKEKLIYDTKTVLKFIQLYCDDKHKDEKKSEKVLQLEFQNNSLHVDLNYKLCEACTHTFLYSYQRLQECEFEEKPSCRKCPKPCYERPKWKELAKIMKYSGMKLGLLKIKKFFSKSS